ncbi:hypothetical protein PybrP1_000440 [[Pythium] brassicae (nom. inval.)]|nr:hypothetical protein PybrP1_000440 [[Pythium] brassicae (nom. inval.)]
MSFDAARTRTDDAAYFVYQSTAGGGAALYDGRMGYRTVVSDEEERELASLLVGDDENDDEDDLGDAAASASAAGRRSKQSVLQRRRRNRESMRRSRMKEKEVLSTLRTTLSQLEQRYEVLTRYEAQGQGGSDARRAALYKALQKKLSHAIQLKRELEAERTVVQRFLHAREESVQKLHKVFAACEIEAESAAVTERLAVLEDQARKHMVSEAVGANSGVRPHAPSEFGFAPYSALQVDALLAEFMGELARVKELARVAALQQQQGQQHGPGQQSFFLEVLGWQTHRHIDAQNQMHFEFTKAFFHLGTDEVVARAWADAVDLAQHTQPPKNGRKPRRIVQRMEFLQRVSPHVGLVVREIKHPEDDTVFRTHYALFMRETHEGFVFGIQSINPSAEQQQQQCQADPAAHKVVWVDAFVAIELIRRPRHPHDVRAHRDAQRQDYCEVRWRGKTNYKTPKHAAENAVGFLMGVLRWEIDVVGPVFHLTAS